MSAVVFVTFISFLWILWLLWILTSERMVKNDEKHLQIMKIVCFPSCVREREAHVMLMKKNEECFSLFSNMYKHAFAGRNTQYLVVYLTLKSVQMISLNVMSMLICEETINKILKWTEILGLLGTIQYSFIFRNIFIYFWIKCQIQLVHESAVSWGNKSKHW